MKMPTRWRWNSPFFTANFVVMNCLLFNAQWMASYSGPPDEEEEFFKVLAGIHDVKN